MTLIVEDGTVVTDANSYDTVAEAQAYFDLKGVVVTITEESLINATQYIDVTFGSYFIPRKLTAEQELQWPRHTFNANDGFVIKQGNIPKDLKTALYETAKLYIEGLDLFNDVKNDTDNLQSLTNSVEGAVSQSKTWFSPTNTSKKQNIGKYLTNLIDGSANQSVRVR